MADKYRKKAEDTLLLALACGAPVEQAARQCGLSARTVYRRLAEADFRRRVQALRCDMVSRAAGTLAAGASGSARTLLELQQKSASDAVRLGAARAVLELGMKVRDAADLEERLAALENAVAGGAKERP